MSKPYINANSLCRAAELKGWTLVSNLGYINGNVRSLESPDEKDRLVIASTIHHGYVGVILETEFGRWEFDSFREACEDLFPEYAYA